MKTIVFFSLKHPVAQNSESCVAGSLAGNTLNIPFDSYENYIQQK